MLVCNRCRVFFSDNQSLSIVKQRIPASDIVSINNLTLDFKFWFKIFLYLYRNILKSWNSFTTYCLSQSCRCIWFHWWELVVIRVVVNTPLEFACLVFILNVLPSYASCKDGVLFRCVCGAILTVKEPEQKDCCKVNYYFLKDEQKYINILFV